MFDRENIFEIDFYSSVKFYPYRTAQVYDLFFVMNRETDTGKEFEKKLSEMAGVHPDNHTVYTITNDMGQKIHVWCSDGDIRFGSKITVGDLWL